jgi:hypothetical protein
MPVLWPPFRTADFHKPLTFVGRQTLTSHFDFDCTLLMEFDAVRLSSRPQDQRRQQWSHSKSPGRISSEWCWISPARRDLGVSTESWTILKRASSKKLCQEMIISLRPRKCATVFFLPVSVYQHDILVLLEFRCFTITTSICGRAPVMSSVSLSPIPMMPSDDFSMSIQVV